MCQGNSSTMSQRTLYFATSNDEKYREIRNALLSTGYEVVRLEIDLPEIQSLDPIEVASAKAQQAFVANEGKGPVLVEDTGLAIRAWHGYPGALIKWVLDAVGEAGLCRQLDAWDDRRATAMVVLCLFDGTETHLFTGQSDGYITAHPRGVNGFGWDSIFQPEGYPVTYGQMLREDKMKISMRARALEGLRHYLKTGDDGNTADG